MNKAITKKPQIVRGRPRSSKAQQAIVESFINAVRDRGYTKVSIDGVARNAGVSRSTIYRWYRDKSEIALEAAAQFAESPTYQTFAGNFENNIDAFLQHTFATANDLAQLFTALMAQAQADKDFAQQVWDRFSSIRRRALNQILLSASSSASKKPVDNEVVLDMVFGAIWYRLMSGHAPLDKAFRKDLLTAIKALLQQAGT